MRSPKHVGAKVRIRAGESEASQTITSKPEFNNSQLQPHLHKFKCVGGQPRPAYHGEYRGRLYLYDIIDIDVRCVDA